VQRQMTGRERVIFSLGDVIQLQRGRETLITRLEVRIRA